MDKDRTKIMGILNVTPDSFSDGGLFFSTQRAVERGLEMLSQGADIIDIGGESTRPGAEPVPANEEIDRVIPVIETLSKHCIVSIDTQKIKVANEAIDAGATVLNDISASLFDIAAEKEVAWIAMHKQGSPKSMQQNPKYIDAVAEVCDYLSEKAKAAMSSGVNNLWIDPGFGFGKSLEHNLQLLRNLDTFVNLQWPVCVGISRKSMLGHLLKPTETSGDIVPEEDRLEGSLSVAIYAMMEGVDLLRVHDVAETYSALNLIQGKQKCQKENGPSE